MKPLLMALFLSLEAVAAIPKPGQANNESARLNAFFEAVFKRELMNHPVQESQLGGKTNYDKWEDFSEAQAAAELSRTLGDLATLKRDFNYELLDHQTKLSYKLFESAAARAAEGFQFRLNNYPINQMYGIHSFIPTFLINVHRIDSVSDANAYIARLRGVTKLIDQSIDGLRLRAERAIIPPKFVFPLVLDACEKIIQGNPFDGGPDNPVLADFAKKVNALANISAAEKNQLIAEAKATLLSSFKPAYQKLIDYLKQLETRASEVAGVWKFANGASFYEFQLKQITTTDLTASQIHDIGLKEVARIHNEMKVIKDKVKFAGDLQAFFKFMREDKQFYLPQTEEGKKEYLNRAVKIIDHMKSRLDESFNLKPKADVVVKAVEAFREKSAGKAFYQRPSADGQRPGMFYVNLSDMASVPTYSLEALAYHEGIPGHHMQIAIAQELNGIPEFRKFGGYTAYIEGWGLYSELIPKEMGLYQDPYSDFGRLALELWRAARLVVDTGIHHKRWTREQAIDYLKQNTPNAEADCVDSINRYIVMPGQATAYKIGMLKIVELRQLAKDTLKSRFDIRQFHDIILRNGAVPLSVLEELVKEWIKSLEEGKAAHTST